MPEELDEEKKWKLQTIKQVLEALKGLGAVRKYDCHFNIKDTITVMWNKYENYLYTLRTQKKQWNNWHSGQLKK